MFILVASPVQAADPDPLQDFCIADLSQGSFFNGYPCVIAPHTHNLATELVFVTAGELYIGFVANSDDVSAPNKLFAGMVKAGEAFVIPRGLVHFQMNNGTINASTINFLNSHNPGISFLPLTLFAAQPAVDPALLARSFAVDQTALSDLAVFWSPFSNVFV
ncbi:protein MpCupin45 [Marchantia polymorpha subsp. ruderalis]|uniref:Germin-like protein n=1 Tax=Marchantia polymorpha TaxID=3197 RepID=A0A2R6W1Y9_MARPO|nr:hypothetical protein MARPO_0181s0008 [Marchantia polymorpha]BBN03615.1 hypothetical protein Mp_2g24890 [Marchantia polymorpha subsp. ruderalis]|eukprot:PTQ27860.1 hypothetical protein MARPO_0181s0008 [Marchantia polymorpha]